MVKINEVPGFEMVKDNYFVTTCGKVINNKWDNIYPRVVEGSPVSNGIYVALMTKDNKTKRTRMHILVAKAFLIEGEYFQILHLNGDKNCNSVTNLDYI